jgi:predicted PurR-regulated permease PerM
MQQQAISERERKLLHSTYPIEIALLVVALVVFLVIIGNVLVQINDNLHKTDAQASAVNRSTNSLPGLIGSITGSLQSIQHDVRNIPGQLDQINAGLDQAQKGLGVANDNLTSTNGALSHTSDTLVTALAYADRVKNGSIAIVNELGTAGGQLATAINLLSGVHSDAANISGLATAINGHLTSINNLGGLGQLIPNLPGLPVAPRVNNPLPGLP